MGEDSHFDSYIFQMGWNHQLGIYSLQETEDGKIFFLSLLSLSLSPLLRVI